MMPGGCQCGAIRYEASGSPIKLYVRVADSGRRLRLMFCPACGSRVWHDREGVDWPTVSIEGGSLDRPPDLSPAVHVWTSHKLPGVVIPEDAAQFPRGD